MVNVGFIFFKSFMKSSVVNEIILGIFLNKHDFKMRRIILLTRIIQTEKPRLEMLYHCILKKRN